MKKRNAIQTRSLFEPEPEPIGEPVVLPGELPELEVVKEPPIIQKTKPIPFAQSPNDVPEAPRRLGTDLKPGDEVNLLPGPFPLYAPYENEPFVVVSVTPFQHCESRFNIIAELKSNPEIRTVGSTATGIDANWFKKIV